MPQEINFKELKNAYLTEYQESILKNETRLYGYWLPWDEVLNEIERKFYQDFRSAGARMYPYYPADDLFIDFANPFHKFALLIKYKNTKVLELESKIEYLEARKWNVFVLESKSVTHSALSIFEFENLGDQTDFEEMTDDQRTDFFKKYSLVNSECFAEWINKYTN